MLQLSDSQIHLWHVDHKDFESSLLESRCMDWLTPLELKRYQRYYFDRHRKQFLLGRMLMRSVLSRYSDVEPERWHFVENDYGKPSIDAAQRAEPLFFNLSHSGERLVLAVSRHEAIGVDMESTEKSRRVLQIADRYFSPAEVAALEALPVGKQLARFYDLWTLKEAYIKACGLGLAIPLRQFSFSFESSDRIAISFAADLDDVPTRWQFWQLDLADSYTLSLALGQGKDAISQVQSWVLQDQEQAELVDSVILRY